MAFNNAGAYSAGSVVDVTEEEFHRIFNLNVWGVLACMKHEIAAMLKTGGGSIINCSSVVGQKAFPNSSIYVASKHAVEGLTKSAALEFATQGIRINSLAPGPFPTEIAGKVIPEEVIKTFEVIIPLHRLGRTKELIPAILFLLSPSNSFVVGATVAVDGGMLA